MPATCPRTTGKHADLLLASEEFELVVLDVGLPDIDGFEVLRRLRQRRSTTSVLVLTARDAVEDRVHGLDLGADDYLTKPFSVKEFEARVRALLRRGVTPAHPGRSREWSSTSRRSACASTTRPSTSLHGNGRCSSCSSTQPGRVLSKDQIADSLFAFDEQLSPNAIEVHVSRLRTKIEPAGGHSHGARIRLPVGRRR